jgi:uncharacterized protein with FMN-binding domain
VKRVLLAITGTVAGLAALLSFKSHTVQLTAPSPVVPSPVVPSRTPVRSNPTSHRAQRYTGPAVQTPYGVVQVAVKVAGRHITAVTLPRLTAFDSTSQMINSQAAPLLVQETLAAQSAHIDTISGATYTSDGYLQSLQAALNKAGL